MKQLGNTTSMNKIILVLLLLAPSALTSQTNQPNFFEERTGNNLLFLLQSEHKEKEVDRLIATTWIQGFKDGFMAAPRCPSDLRGEELLECMRKKVLCIPEGVIGQQFIDVVEKYLVDNPTMRHRSAAFLTSIAMLQAFPCHPE